MTDQGTGPPGDPGNPAPGAGSDPRHGGTDLVLWVEDDETRRRREAREERQRQREERRQRGEAEAELVDMMRRAYELHAAGVTYRDMERRLGVPKSTLQRMVKRHIRRCAPIEDPKEYVARHLAEIDWARKKLVGEFLLGRIESPRMTDALLKLQIREEAIVGFSDFSLTQFQQMSRDEMRSWLRS